ncbi:hypothetical protein SDJN02_14529 [Cucurbita argyrosperma subsp. argyrosperma]|nr:hypothetical protein SDJN02_14529 [Cucurbita argyrosperma subsp. argyrosperma]
MSRIEPYVSDSCSEQQFSLQEATAAASPPPPLRAKIGRLFFRTATVAAVRDAVESVFCGMSMNKEDDKISWPHVRCHFCLCYKHYKLIDDKSRIKQFEIIDVDKRGFGD